MSSYISAGVTVATMWLIDVFVLFFEQQWSSKKIHQALELVY